MNFVAKVRNRIQKTFFKTDLDRAYDRWLMDRGDQTLRLDYSLNPQSIVFDLGGYEGDWADQIYTRYGCTVFVFEPVQRFADKIAKRFSGNEKIKVFSFGLGGKDQELEISLNENSSSVFISDGPREKIRIRKIQDFFAENRIQEIDLMKINIEGGEFELLLGLLSSGDHKKVKNFQIQFHQFVPDAKALREKIRERLKNTHKCTYEYSFIWENWERLWLTEIQTHGKFQGYEGRIAIF